jgi:hypothetical protein
MSSTVEERVERKMELVRNDAEYREQEFGSTLCNWLDDIYQFRARKAKSFA